MALPVFSPTSAPTVDVETLSRAAAAARLEVHAAHVNKMVAAGMLPLPITTASIEPLRGRPRLQVTAGELTVLRTGARRAVDPGEFPGDARRWIGFHVDHTDAELDETCLRWWRSDPDRIVGNELLAVCVGNFPVAVYRVTGVADTVTRQDEDAPRHHYNGTLLARVTRGMVATRREQLPGHLRRLTDQIMGSRIAVESGGPIGYLEPAAAHQHRGGGAR